ncbi:hypothetical protein HG530_003987 [Fusarium avenaceum]|nr:hypothetical protein HG530_003987 [Fusarium avenaceum]
METGSWFGLWAAMLASWMSVTPSVTTLLAEASAQAASRLSWASLRASHVLRYGLARGVRNREVDKDRHITGEAAPQSAQWRIGVNVYQVIAAPLSLTGGELDLNASLLRHKTEYRFLPIDIDHDRSPGRVDPHVLLLVEVETWDIGLTLFEEDLRFRGPHELIRVTSSVEVVQDLVLQETSGDEGSALTIESVNIQELKVNVGVLKLDHTPDTVHHVRVRFIRTSSLGDPDDVSGDLDQALEAIHFVLLGRQGWLEILNGRNRVVDGRRSLKRGEATALNQFIPCIESQHWTVGTATMSSNPPSRQTAHNDTIAEHVVGNGLKINKPTTRLQKPAHVRHHVVQVFSDVEDVGGND